MEKKQLKKLQFKKHIITELKENESLEINGGTGYTRTIYETTSLTSDTATTGTELSWWACETQPVSCQILYGGCFITG